MVVLLDLRGVCGGARHAEGPDPNPTSCVSSTSLLLPLTLFLIMLVHLIEEDGYQKIESF